MLYEGFLTLIPDALIVGSVAWDIGKEQMMPANENKYQKQVRVN